MASHDPATYRQQHVYDICMVRWRLLTSNADNYLRKLGTFISGRRPGASSRPLSCHGSLHSSNTAYRFQQTGTPKHPKLHDTIRNPWQFLRLGHISRHGPFTAPQLKVLQESISLSVFAIFSSFVLRERLRLRDALAFGLIFVGMGTTSALRYQTPICRRCCIGHDRASCTSRPSWSP